MRKYRFIDGILLALVVACLDQYTKFYAAQHLVLHQPIIVNKFFNWYLDYNKGAAFSFLNDGFGWERWILAGFSALVCIIIISVLKNTVDQRTSSKAGLILILGGALGNLIDRAFSGVVTDFIQWHIGDYYWPTFNLADSAVCMGVVFFLWGMR